MEFNLADLFEHAADTWPDREYLVADGRRCTYGEMESRANRLAHHLASKGIGPGDHVGIYAYNCMEWVETLWAVFKLRAVWVNINYRYVEDELAYLFGEADLKALVYAREFAPRVRGVAGRLTMLSEYVVVEDGSGQAVPDELASTPYEAALSAQSAARDFPARSSDDLYILFTGGTTGMPKGVVWRHVDVLMALGGGIDIRTGAMITRPEELVEKGKASGFALTAFATAPLMHGASQWSVMAQSFTGNRVILTARFEASLVWRTVEREKVNLLMITGDAMARPLLDITEDPSTSYDTSSLFALSSTAALFSQSIKDAFLDRFPNLVITDAIGSSESGANGIAMVSKGAPMRGGPTVKAVRDSVVIDDELGLIEPGSGKVGRLARTGNIPIGYYKDQARTAATFLTAPDGTRYAVPGDYATVEGDGTITLLGRGSVSINTGGEKVYPEEVENTLKGHPAVFDAVVVGVADERWGSRVAAVVAPRAGSAPTLEQLQIHCRAHIAGYKVPRQLVLVRAVERSPSGKPDYRWAARVAESSQVP